MADTQRRPTRWFLRQPEPNAQARLFCLPYSGCGASLYRHWPRTMAGVDVCAVQLPGRENRLSEPAYATYEMLADDLAEVLRPYTGRPYGLFGHCSSALAAYETAARMVQRGYAPPTRLFVSSEVAPQDGPYGRFLEMSDRELADELNDLLVGMGRTPSPDLVELTLGVLRADVEVNKRYRVPLPYRLPGPITAIGWTGDTGIEHFAMGGWAACGETTFDLLEGDHYRFIDAPPELQMLFVRDLVAP